MKRLNRILAFAAIILLMALAACGQTAQPVVTGSPAALPPVATGTTTPPASRTVASGATVSRITGAPTTGSGLAGTPSGTPQTPVPGATPDLAGYFNRLMQLGGFHFEGTVQVTSTAMPSQFVQFTQDVDAAGNTHVVVTTQPGGPPAGDIYYVNQHLYIGQNGQYTDLGQQSSQQALDPYELYVLPFELTLSQPADLTKVGTETVNGLSATKYQINLGQSARDYLQLSPNATFTSTTPSYVWYSDQYNVPIRSDINANWADGSDTGQVAVHSNITQVGSVAPIQAPPATPLALPAETPGQTP